MPSLVRYLIDAIACLNSGRTEKVAEGMGCDRTGISVEYAIDLPAAQRPPAAAEKEIWAAGIRPLRQIVPDGINYLVPNKNDSCFCALALANGDLFGCQGDIFWQERQTLADPQSGIGQHSDNRIVAFPASSQYPPAERLDLLPAHGAWICVCGLYLQVVALAEDQIFLDARLDQELIIALQRGQLGVHGTIGQFSLCAQIGYPVIVPPAFAGTTFLQWKSEPLSLAGPGALLLCLSALCSS